MAKTESEKQAKREYKKRRRRVTLSFTISDYEKLKKEFGDDLYATMKKLIRIELLKRELRRPENPISFT